MEESLCEVDVIAYEVGASGGGGGGPLHHQPLLKSTYMLYHKSLPSLALKSRNP